ncbi:hypothetical protein OAU50_08845, partial [Planctomycetota bacterium]|nr:hypothetical protein [Planctomycetota bacterium]
ADKTRIIIKFPTRSRPEKFFHVLGLYVDLLSGKHDVQFVITMDTDDETMNTDEVRGQLDEIGKQVPVAYFYGDSANKIAAVNADLEGVDGNILVVASDDMIPKVQGYDDVIATDMKKYFPNYDGALNYNDGHRKNQDLMTLAVLGYNLYKSWGYIYHPDYLSVYADDEQTDVCRMLGIIKDIDKLIVHHDMPTQETQDELAKKNDSLEMYARDKRVYVCRRRRYFGVLTLRTAVLRLLTGRVWRIKRFPPSFR